jgi:hypothetical protein
LEFFLGFHGSLVVLCWFGFHGSFDLDGNAKSKGKDMLVGGRVNGTV